MSGAITIHCRVNEDGSALALARFTANDGTGQAIPGEGKCLKQADVSTIHYSIIDLKDGSTVVASTSLTPISTYIYDILQKSEVWDLEIDPLGYNFAHTLGAASFPTGDRVYRLLYKFTTTGGVVGWGEYEATTRKTS